MIQTHTKQVEEVMKEIERLDEKLAVGIFPSTNDYMYFKKKMEIEQSILKGMQTAIQNELEFLESHLKYVRQARKNTAGLQPFQYPIQKRIEDCKNALAKIKEVLG